jgi:hypothetical protein
MKELYLIGDIHGRVEDYMQAVHVRNLNLQPSLQVGDLDISYYQFLRKVDAQNHRVLPGNHDHYGHVQKWPHFLGDWGRLEHGGYDLWYVRGAYSIDRDWRTEGRNWWAEEELTYGQGRSMLNDYELARPSIVVSHCAPTEIARLICWRLHGHFGNSRTEELLQQAFDIHHPRTWFFGHYHTPFTCTASGCTFRALGAGEIIRVWEDEQGRTRWTEVRDSTHAQGRQIGPFKDPLSRE